MNIKTIAHVAKFVDADDIKVLLTLFDKYSKKAKEELCKKLNAKSIHYRMNGRGITVTWKEGEEKKTITKSYMGWFRFLTK